MERHLRNLELTHPCSEQCIKNAYRQMALKWHPDKCKEDHATEKFRSICESYSWLKDNYDSNEKQTQSQSQNGPNHDVFLHSMCIRMIFHSIKQGVTSIHQSLQTEIWIDIANLFGIDINVVQQYSLYLHQMLSMKLIYYVFLTLKDKQKTFIERIIFLRTEEGCKKINLIVKVDTNDVIIIPPKESSTDLVNILNDLEVEIID